METNQDSSINDTNDRGSAVTAPSTESDKPESFNIVVINNETTSAQTSENKQSLNDDKLTKLPNQDNQGKPEAGVQINGGKRVRFSICEYITETLVHDNWGNGSHENPAFESETGMGNGKSEKDLSEGGSKLRYVGGKLRRDSVHPLVPFQAQLAQAKRDSDWDVYSPEEDYEKQEDTGEPWSNLSTKQKILRILTGVGKFVGLLVLLYFFVCSLDLLSLGFRLVGGRTAGDIFRQSSILQNPVVGVMIGILTTVLVQSSSTSTSIIVGMVAAGFMDVRIAIPPIMGANIGTSITNTIVSFTQAGDRSQFRRAFAGATILDMFNWITVMVLLPIEVMFGYLYHVSKASVDLIIPDSQSGGEIQVLSVITKPFVDLIVQLNDTVLECWASPNCTDADDASLIQTFCSTTTTHIFVRERVTDNNGKEILNIKDVARQEDLQPCDFLFAGTGMSDAAVGGIILVASLIVLCFCLIMIVKLLSSVLEGHVSTIIKRTLNADIPYVPWITGYLAILIGALMTFLVQSSSVFTSALTPLVGLGVISLNRVYPLTLGANIGTTTTALLASMAADGKSLYPSLQIALCHFFFNMTGVLLFYPVPFLRFPISMAKALGNITAKYRWFAIFYLICMFAVLPAVFILLSLAGSIYVIVLIAIIGVITCIVILMTILQRKIPKMLPEKLRDWKWLPEPMRSLKPYDNLISKMSCCSKHSEEISDDDSDDETFSGRHNVYRDNDFVFLSGNKIPPPLSDDDEHSRKSPRPSITRIVPTRVIRNISNGNGEFIQVNERSSVDNGQANDSIPPPQEQIKEIPYKEEANNSTTLINSSEGETSTVNSNSSVSKNTLPIPYFVGESLGTPVNELENNKHVNIDDSVVKVEGDSKNPNINLAFNGSRESFHV